MGGEGNKQREWGGRLSPPHSGLLIFSGNVLSYSSDQFHKVFSGAPHLKEDHAEFAS
jgi:hypothetical protein